MSSKNHVAVRSYVSSKIEIAPSQIHGQGMFALSTIAIGEIVFIKGGHIATRAQVWSKSQINSYLPLDDEFVLGALSSDEEPGIKLFLNHSCEPNCGLRGEISFVAMREIKRGEEITCDYCVIDNEEYIFRCTCGTMLCRGEVSGYDWMREDLQKKYRGYFARYLADKM